MSKPVTKTLKVGSIETHPTRSLEAARQMAFASSDVEAKRIAYTDTLIRESKALGDYIAGKRLSAKTGSQA